MLITNCLVKSQNKKIIKYWCLHLQKKSVIVMLASPQINYWQLLRVDSLQFKNDKFQILAHYYEVASLDCSGVQSISLHCKRSWTNVLRYNFIGCCDWSINETHLYLWLWLVKYYIYVYSKKFLFANLLLVIVMLLV